MTHKAVNMREEIAVAAARPRGRGHVWTVTYMDAERRLIPIRVMAADYTSAAAMGDLHCAEKNWNTAGWRIVELTRMDVIA